MSLSAAFILAAAAPAAQGEPVAHGVRLAQAQVSATILAPVVVRQDGGLEQAGRDTPRHQLTRQGNTVLVEFQ